MWALIRDTDYPTLVQSEKMLKEPECESVAIHEQIILANTDRAGVYTVVWNGTPSGTLEDRLYTPNHEEDCLTKLSRMALQEVRGICL